MAEALAAWVGYVTWWFAMADPWRREAVTIRRRRDATPLGSLAASVLRDRPIHESAAWRSAPRDFAGIFVPQ